MGGEDSDGDDYEEEEVPEDQQEKIYILIHVLGIFQPPRFNFEKVQYIYFTDHL
jgi:hypothetical protein